MCLMREGYNPRDRIKETGKNVKVNSSGSVESQGVAKRVAKDLRETLQGSWR